MTELTQGFGDQTLTHVLVEAEGQARATLLLFPTVMGVTDLEAGFARDFASRGFRVLVADLFGRRFAPAERADAMTAMTALRSDRGALRDRLLAVLDLLRSQNGVEPARIAALGFCFGGQCALDLARTGTELAVAASFHGLFDPPGLPPQPIRAKVAAYHGWADNLAKPDAVVALGEELTAAGADWQLHAYGGVGHAFTNPGAAPAPGFGYDEATSRRSFAAFYALLDETFGSV
jgi:dienelactone hydrolase